MKKSKGLTWHDPEKVALSSVQFAAYNPRRMPPERMRQLKASLLKHGVVLNLVVQRKSEAYGANVLIGGHQRIVAAREICKERGWPDPEHGWAVFVDVPDAVAKQLNVSLNNVGGEFDPHLLGLLLADVREAGEVDFLALGLGEDNVAELIRAATATPDQQAAELEREAAGLMNSFTPSPTLTLEFATSEERDEAKAMIAERAKADGVKGGAVVLAALKRKAKK